MNSGKDLGQQSIGEILSSLTIKQVWALGGALVVLLAGSFSLGSWTGNQLMRSELNRAEAEKIQLESQVKGLTETKEQAEGIIDLLRIKEKILAQIALYHSYKARASTADATTEARDRFAKQGEELFRTVNEYARKTMAGESEPSVKVRVGKGAQPSVVFEFDQTSFPLPAELFAIAE